MAYIPDDISLQEPLIQFTYPPRDDLGWQLLCGQPSSTQSIEEDITALPSPVSPHSSGSTKSLAPVDNQTADITDRMPGDLQLEIFEKTPEKTLDYLVTAARQPAIHAEQTAKASRIAAQEALASNDLASTLELRFEAAGSENTALDAHRRASCIIYTALNQDLPSGTIDLRGLRVDELAIVRKIITMSRPDVPVYRFIMDDSDGSLQRKSLDYIAKEHGLAYYYDGPATCIFLQDPRQWRTDRLVEAVKNARRERI